MGCERVRCGIVSGMQPHAFGLVVASPGRVALQHSGHAADSPSVLQMQARGTNMLSVSLSILYDTPFVFGFCALILANKSLASLIVFELSVLAGVCTIQFGPRMHGTSKHRRRTA